VTGDDSRNNWWLALITLGEGWHNNHHHYQSSTRQGFYWWEVDISYYVLKVLSWFGLVWDLRAPPEAIVHGERRLGRKVIEKVAIEVAESFPVEKIARDIEAAWHSRPGLQELGIRLQQARDDASASFARTREDVAEVLREIHLPEVPSFEEVRRRITERYEEQPSIDDIAERAREIIIEKISEYLGPDPSPAMG